MGRIKGTCASLLALGGVVSILWITSYRRAIDVQLPARVGGCAARISLYRGLTAIILIPDSPVRCAGWLRLSNGRDEVRAACWDELTWNPSLAGFSFDDGITYLDEDGAGVSRRYESFTLPLWFAVALSAGGLACRARNCYVERRRAALGQCTTCGYDLRGLKIDCPACAALVHTFGASSHLALGGR